MDTTDEWSADETDQPIDDAEFTRAWSYLEPCERRQLVRQMVRLIVERGGEDWRRATESRD